MANKRMFSKEVVGSDAFAMMSASAQLLYFHLGMNADDDGVLATARQITKLYGLPQKALQELLNKRFLLDLGDGILVIKHWRMNNIVQKDRYKPTAYKEKLAQLRLNENGSYTDDVNKLDTVCIQFGYSLETQNKNKNKNKNKSRYTTLPDFYQDDENTAPQDTNDIRKRLGIEEKKTA